MTDSDEPGVFTISLDTELAWGCFDTLGVEPLAESYRNVREVIDRLCALFSTRSVPATWAMVAHLFDDCRERESAHSAQPAPEYEWVEDWFSAVPCASGVAKELWYAPELLERVRSCGVEQEIGLHGYTHMVLGEQDCSRAVADAEIAAAVAVARKVNVDPKSFVYPRNRVGHTELLPDHGLDVYRGVDARWYERRALPSRVRKPLRYADEALAVTPPAVVPRSTGGVVEVPGSQVFRPRRGGWRYTPYDSQRRRAIEGLDRAAETGNVFHLWCHPYDLVLETDALLAALGDVLAHAERLREAGRLEVLPLREVAAEHRAGRWSGERRADRAIESTSV
jgi:peptidoglycan/xylan/chitin deacetylase (PgdA/CDA1 family)